MKVYYMRNIVSCKQKKAIFSVFNNFKDTSPLGQMGIEQLYHTIRTGGRSGAIRDGINALRSADGVAERKKIKAMLPVATVSGVFSHRTNDGLIAHSGLLQVDIDYTGNEDRIDAIGGAERMAALVAAKYPPVAIACVSPSGNGVKAVVSLDFDSIADYMPLPDMPTQHALLAATVASEFAERFGLAVDTAGSRIAQAMIIPYDHDAMFWSSPEPATLSPAAYFEFMDQLIASADAAAAAELAIKAANVATPIKGNSKEAYYTRAIDNTLRRVIDAPHGSRHVTATRCAPILIGLARGAELCGLTFDVYTPFIAAYVAIGGKEKKAIDIWRWAADRHPEPHLPADRTGWVGKIVSVNGVGAWRVIGAWEKANGNVSLDLENNVSVPASKCKEVGK